MAQAGDAGVVKAGIGIDPTKWWIVALVGVALIVMAFVVLGHLMAATIISTILIGAMLSVGGLFQIVHAFAERGWGGFALSLLVGLLYLATGLTVGLNPISGSLAITLLFAAFLLASGVVRIVLAFRFWHMFGWLLLISGVFGILAALVIMTGYPMTGLWVLGFVLGIDLLMYGVWWLMFSFLIRGTRAG
jgi:uncharacterized membrane protein HdeD (DUF308 family)